MMLKKSPYVAVCGLCGGSVGGWFVMVFVPSFVWVWWIVAGRALWSVSVWGRGVCGASVGAGETRSGFHDSYVETAARCRNVSFMI